MRELEGLSTCIGTWSGTSRLMDPGMDILEESPSTLTVVPLLGGRFVRLDYAWEYRGTPQEGSFLIGYDKDADAVTAHWIDSWHMGGKVMSCLGALSPAGGIDVRGSYAAPPGPDWGWRSVIGPEEEKALRITMFNISPDGREEAAVEAAYRRA